MCCCWAACCCSWDMARKLLMSWGLPCLICCKTAACDRLRGVLPSELKGDGPVAGPRMTGAGNCMGGRVGDGRPPPPTICWLVREGGRPTAAAWRKSGSLGDRTAKTSTSCSLNRSPPARWGERVCCSLGRRYECPTEQYERSLRSPLSARKRSWPLPNVGRESGRWQTPVNWLRARTRHCTGSHVTGLSLSVLPELLRPPSSPSLSLSVSSSSSSSSCCWCWCCCCCGDVCVSVCGGVRGERANSQLCRVFSNLPVLFQSRVLYPPNT
mmetsp:Transcript_17941/g.51028  ORF Transcript_17941/g.51028 Transcript_17941/m.51028 type:complete len:269 (+) Transcript_17941:544-1350(+)